MYQVGQQVLYGVHGVCSIVSIESMRFGKKTEQYYILRPVLQSDSKYYVPVANESAVAKMRPLLTREELTTLLRSEAVRQDLWVNDENQRKLRFREILARGDRAELLCMIASLYRHKKTQQSAGRKFHVSDEGLLKDAEKLINMEFSHVLGIEPDHIGSYILSQTEMGD